MADFFSQDALEEELEFAVDIDEQELARVKAEYGITDTENAAALWVREARMHRDVALRVALKLQGQRNYWRAVAQRAAPTGGGGGGGGGNDDARAPRSIGQDNEADVKLAGLVRHAEQARAQDTPFDLFPVERRPEVVSTAAAAVADATAVHTATAADGAASPPEDGGKAASAGSSLLFLSRYYQQMALLTTRLVESMAVGFCSSICLCVCVCVLWRWWVTCKNCLDLLSEIPSCFWR